MPKKRKSLVEFERQHKLIRELVDDVIAKRNVEAEFQGLENELRRLQREILETYRNSNQLKHPRDKGDYREEILRKFLLDHGLIPKKYSVSDNRVRAVSSDGQVSPELDIVFYDNLESIVLRRLGTTADYLPIESIYGTIQVKSKLSRRALAEGLDNIKRFKNLSPNNIKQKIGGLTVQTGAYRRFAILFAYEYDLEWDKICDEIYNFIKANPPELWPNFIVILNRGYILIGDKEIYAWKNSDQLKINYPILHGNPNEPDQNLLFFYNILILLLTDTATGAPDIERYFRMPFICDNISYKFAYGAFVELMTCPISEHGTYLKKFREGKLKMIFESASNAEPINFLKALDIAQGGQGVDFQSYQQQPSLVNIYNPENLELKDLLMDENGSLSFENILVEDLNILVPYYYISKENLFNDCPKCSELDRRFKRKP